MALDFQILLLPKKDYWAWLDASRDYVLTFGANLTPEPDVAGAYMRPRQVVSFPYYPGGFPEIGDAVRWFHDHYGGVRLDPVDSDDPHEFHKDLKRRIEDNDRYGAMQRPFHLVWPTDYTVITQAFGANPQIYRRYGMPGHEGVDVRALTNTDVYAGADGEVYEVHLKPKDHAYGIHVRIEHLDGYKTVYGHLARALVRKGDSVRAGQVIGKADSTGNSSGSHLHLSLKRDGATARKETIYPKDIIDPTPYLVWPAAKAGKYVPGRPKVETGLNLTAAGSAETGVLESVRRVRPGAVLISHVFPTEGIAELRNVARGLRILARIAAAPEDGSGQPARHVARVASDVGRLYRAGVRDYEVAPSPNDVQGGFGRVWKDGGEFGEWFVDVSGRLKEIFPEIRLGFPSLVPGEDVSGRQAAPARFLEEAETGASLADWIGAMVWLGRGVNGGGMAASSAPSMIASRFPGKPIFVTAADDPSQSAAPEARAMAFSAFLRSTEAAGVEVVLFGGLRRDLDGDGLSWEAAKILAEAAGPPEPRASSPT